MSFASRLLPIALILQFPLAAMSHVSAETFEIVIHHAELEDVGVAPKVGDTIKFANHADIAHNLYLTYEDGTVETLDTQVPGSVKSTVLSRAGKVVVRCWIHPVIRLQMTVRAGS